MLICIPLEACCYPKDLQKLCYAHGRLKFPLEKLRQTGKMNRSRNTAKQSYKPNIFFLTNLKLFSITVANWNKAMYDVFCLASYSLVVYKQNTHSVP